MYETCIPTVYFLHVLILAYQCLWIWSHVNSIDLQLSYFQIGLKSTIIKHHKFRQNQTSPQATENHKCQTSDRWSASLSISIRSGWVEKMWHLDGPSIQFLYPHYTHYTYNIHTIAYIVWFNVHTCNKYLIYGFIGKCQDLKVKQQIAWHNKPIQYSMRRSKAHHIPSFHDI